MTDQHCKGGRCFLGQISQSFASTTKQLTMHSFWIFLYGSNLGEMQPATWCPGQWAVLLPSLPPGPEASYLLSPVVERDVGGEYNWAHPSLQRPENSPDTGGPGGGAPGWDWKGWKDSAWEGSGVGERELVDKYSTGDRGESHGTVQRPLPVNGGWNWTCPILPFPESVSRVHHRKSG